MLAVSVERKGLTLDVLGVVSLATRIGILMTRLYSLITLGEVIRADCRLAATLQSTATRLSRYVIVSPECGPTAAT